MLERRNEVKGTQLRVNMRKTKVMCCKVRTGQTEHSVKWPCAVCKKDVGANSINCTVCREGGEDDDKVDVWSYTEGQEIE